MGEAAVRADIATLNRRQFDVCVIGAGLNGAATAQQLAAAGYNVLLVDKGDFGSGSSSRSSRLLHCGLRYLAPGTSMWDFLWHPSRLRTALRMARLGMEARRELVLTTPERVQSMEFYFPIWNDSVTRPWQFRIGTALLASMAPGDVPLGHGMLTPEAAKKIPLVRGLRRWDALQSVGVYAEYQLEWAERLCVDSVLDAERLGAVVRNYTGATRLTRQGDQWLIQLSDTLYGGTATVQSRLVLNMAGIWIDRVNGNSGRTVPRKILGTKGCHIVVQLPPECAGKAIVTFDSHQDPFYCIPWRGLHYFGPTETVYEGDPDKIFAEEAEIAGLIREANDLLPGLGLKRADVLSTWAGVRPLTFDPSLPKGKRSRDIHDLGEAGLPGVYAMTAAPAMTYRSGGADMVAVVRRRLEPSGTPRPLSYAARKFPDAPQSPPVVKDWTTAKIADLIYAAGNEHATSLTDLMFRRVGAAWTKTMGYDAANDVAEAVAGVLGWDAARAMQEAESYRAYLREIHTVRTA
jgi:glycerol-3-phosphate dehydrogenase